MPGHDGEHSKAYNGPTIDARVNAAGSGQARDFDAALDAFCDDWNRGIDDRARFEKEYLLAIGTRESRSPGAGHRVLPVPEGGQKCRT